MLKPTQDKEANLTELEIRGIRFQSYCSEGVALDNLGQYHLTEFTIKLLISKIIDAQITKLEMLGYHKGLPSNIEEALNSGDGVYRP